MWKTVVLLIISLIVVPTLAFFLDEPLSPEQKKLVWLLIWVYIIAAGLCFIISTITKNYSQVDKLWSTIPMAYTWIVAIKTGFDPRTVLMAILVTIWGIRLTYNFTRRGGFSWKFWEGEEDYRWAVLRQRKEFQGKLNWMLFNLFFISFYQMGLVLMICFPAVKSIRGGTLSIWDGVLSLLILGLILIETIADQQQWNFHSEKNRLKAEGKLKGSRFEKGFVAEGLWSIVRHPNYAAEQGVWIVFYFFSVIVTGNWLNWSVMGALLLMILFKGSSDFSEKISASKYPEYSNYQKSVGRFIPKIPAKRNQEEEVVIQK